MEQGFDFSFPETSYETLESLKKTSEVKKTYYKLLSELTSSHLLNIYNKYRNKEQKPGNWYYIMREINKRDLI